MEKAVRPRLKVLGPAQLDRIPQLELLPEEDRLAIETVATVLPFRVNEYVVEELIDWNRVPEDPIFQLTFPQRGMLAEEDFRRMRRLVRAGAGGAALAEAADEIRRRMNPHPAGQMECNVPQLDGQPLPGMQHKYRDTVLFFPSQGQTCHTYCTYCFRWAQFVGIEELKFAQRETETFHEYLRRDQRITDVLFTGGDPMVMSARNLRGYITPLLGPGFEHIRDIRIGTKSVAWWPHRFVTDPDADAVLRLFEEVVAAGKHLALMAHYSHPVELSTDMARECVRRIRGTGAVIRCQAPLVRHVNDSSRIWADLWSEQVRLGCVPYYMFVERDTGPRNYFEVPLARAFEIFRRACRSITGLARTVRGPSMSATPGKVQVVGVSEVAGEKVFVLSFVRGRNPDWVRRVFFARFDPDATWLDQLRPAFGEERFFFEGQFGPEPVAWE